MSATVRVTVPVSICLPDFGDDFPLDGYPLSTEECEWVADVDVSEDYAYIRDIRREDAS